MRQICSLISATLFLGGYPQMTIQLQIGDLDVSPVSMHFAKAVAYVLPSFLGPGTPATQNRYGQDSLSWVM